MFTSSLFRAEQPLLIADDTLYALAVADFLVWDRTSTLIVNSDSRAAIGITHGAVKKG